MNENNDFDLDDDIFEDDQGDGKVSLKKLWEENPIFKIAVIVGAIIILYIGYSVLFSGDDDDLTASRVAGAPTVTAIPGEGEADPAFRAAIEERDRQRAEEAFRINGSMVPTPIGANDTQIDSPSVDLDLGDEDPLATWRRTQEAVQITQQDEDERPQRPQQQAPVFEPFDAPPPPLQPQVTQMQPQMQPQQMQQMQPQVDGDLTQRFAQQMQVIMGARQPQSSNIISARYPSMYAQYLQEREQMGTAARGNRLQSATGTLADDSAGFVETGMQNCDAEREVLLSAGSISYAQIVNAVNSDVNGPVLAHILSGPFAGGRAIGRFQMQEEFLVLVFNRVVKDDVVYSTEAYALDADTTLPAVRTGVNRHWVRRVILPAAAEFISGMGSAIAQQASRVTVVDGAAVVEQDTLDTEQQLARGVERGAQRVAQVLEQDQSRRVTVTLDKGTPVGLLFTQSITTGDADR